MGLSCSVESLLPTLPQTLLLDAGIFRYEDGMEDAYIISLYEAFERIKIGGAPVFASGFYRLGFQKMSSPGLMFEWQ